ncbi:uncharacterized protein HMPREF1541_00994 [Cyphellophora europaea CBS 101466]|uniref:DUF1740-domain-containing protein n=1 Tax=Cyphellophora europaea (strain CBS 101466) TaxID=1220924 RepID=W2SDV2_CYPE1|nr:uncharacterized protein HMPREF1541_00994 [Cyphellophora europaea CBS 101466]ETN46805.1 hypothetical protein HMPREF1541_00994 [Cyphellophora europaea CBS 101466]
MESALDLLLKRDVKGDRDNLRYGSLEKSTIPKYRVAGRGSIIGLPRAYKVKHIPGGARQISGPQADTGHRHANNSLLSPAPQPSTRPIPKRESVNDDPIRRQSSYISVRAGSSRKRRRLSDLEHPFSIIDHTAQPDQDDSSSAGDEDDIADEANAYEAFRSDTVQRRQRELLKRTNSDPEDLDAWLALIEHQQELVRGSESNTTTLSPSQRRTLIELRISLYQQALSKVTTSDTRQRLIVGLMQEGSKIWDHAKQTEEWQKLLNDSASVSLRVLHINFLMTNPWTFSYPGCLQAIDECLQIYLAEPTSEIRDDHVVYLLLRATLLMKQAGYAERAVAVWQGNLEINFFPPSECGTRDLTARFETFWDSEAPRLGEADVQGWNKSTGEEPASAQSREGEIPPPTLDRPDPAWAAAEGQIQAHATLPARTLDDTDDPFRVVLFADIQAYLFHAMTAQTKAKLLEAFLCFAGLPPLQRCQAVQHLDPFLIQPLRAPATSEPPSPYPPLRSFNTGGADPVLLFAHKDDPFAAFQHNLDAGLSSLILAALQQLALADPEDELLAQYVIALTLTLSTSPAGAVRKFAKSLIKRRPESSRLYNAYALVERRLGKHDSAERVWITTLNMKAGHDPLATSQRLLLYHSWIWELALAEQDAKVLALMSRLPATQPKLDDLETATAAPPAPELLSRFEHFLRSCLSRAYSGYIPDEIVVCADLLALLQYYTSCLDLHVALVAYQQILSMSGLQLGSSQIPSTAGMTVERIHISRARLISLHTYSHNVQFKPKEVISTLRDSVSAFPHNTVFRHLLHDFSLKHGAVDRLREAAAAATVTSTTIAATGEDQSKNIATNPPPALDLLLSIEHLQRIDNELSRDPIYGGTEHAIRAAFQRAKADDSPVRSCPAIQLRHLQWELSLLRREAPSLQQPGGVTGRNEDNKQRQQQQLEKKARKQQVQRVRTTFHEAVAACPWMKSIYLTYFDERLGGAEGAVDEEWNETYESMLERGLRLHIELPNSQR